VRGYWRRLSGPLLDRIDLVITVDPVPLDELIVDAIQGEPSATVRARVVAARAAQAERAQRLAAPDSPPRASPTNAAIPASQLSDICPLTPELQRQAREQATQLGISARAWHRILRVARTIADLQGRNDIRSTDLSEAFQYRQTNIELGERAAQLPHG
jgi:magnesium chelatase family protein